MGRAEDAGRAGEMGRAGDTGRAGEMGRAGETGRAGAKGWAVEAGVAGGRYLAHQLKIVTYSAEVLKVDLFISLKVNPCNYRLIGVEILKVDIIIA